MRNREEGGNHPEKTPGPRSTRPGRAGLTPLPAPPPQGSGAAGPLHVTAPSHSLLPLKPRSLEQPGGGGFLRGRRFRTLGTITPGSKASLRSRRFRAPAPHTPRPGPESTAAPRVEAWAGRGRGGAGLGGGRGVRVRARSPRGRRAPPPPGRRRPGAYVSRGKSPAAGRRLSSGRRSAPRRFAPWLLHPGRATPGEPQREN